MGWIFFFSFRNPRNGREKNNEQTFRFHHSRLHDLPHDVLYTHFRTLWHYGVNGVVFASSRQQHFALRASLRRSNSSEFCVSKHGQKKKMLTHTHVLEISPLLRIAVWLYFFYFFFWEIYFCSNWFSIQKFERSQLKKIDKKYVKNTVEPKLNNKF